MSCSLATVHLTQRVTVKLIKKLWGGKEIEAVLERLDRLTRDEARTTAAQTLEVVYGLIQNMRVVMDGESTTLRPVSDSSLIICHSDGKASADGIRDALGTFVGEKKLSVFLIGSQKPCKTSQAKLTNQNASHTLLQRSLSEN